VSKYNNNNNNNPIYIVPCAVHLLQVCLPAAVASCFLCFFLGVFNVVSFNNFPSVLNVDRRECVCRFCS